MVVVLVLYQVLYFRIIRGTSNSTRRLDFGPQSSNMGRQAWNLEPTRDDNAPLQKLTNG
jgi:hypothetical protein